MCLMPAKFHCKTLMNHHHIPSTSIQSISNTKIHVFQCDKSILLKQSFKLQLSCIKSGKNVVSFFHIDDHIIVGVYHGQRRQPILTHRCSQEIVKSVLSVLADRSHSHRITGKVHASFSVCEMLGNCWASHSLIALCIVPCFLIFLMICPLSCDTVIAALSGA